MSESQSTSWWYDHPEPPKDYREQIDSLCSFAVRFDAWKKLLTDTNLRRLSRLKGSFLNFHEPFDELVADFNCTPEELRAAIKHIGHSGTEPIEFIRTDLYDSRAWCVLKLSDFVEFTGNDRAVVDDKSWRNCWNHSNDMPQLHFGVFNQPWTVTDDCFYVEARQKKYTKIAVLFFKHPQNDPHFGAEGRWCAELAWPKGVPKQEMLEKLFAIAEEEAAKQTRHILRRLRGEPPIKFDEPKPHTR